MADDVPATIDIIAGDGSTFFENAIEAPADSTLTPQVALRTLQGNVVGSANPLPTADATAQSTLATLATASAQGTGNTTLASILTKLGAVVLAAGSAVAGKFGIDQTTPGTTNGVVITTAVPAGTNAIGTVLPTAFALSNCASGTIGTSSSVMVPFSSTRKWVTVYNRSSVDFHDWGSSNVAIGNGLYVGPGAGFTFAGSGATGPIYGISTAGSSAFSYVEG